MTFTRTSIMVLIPPPHLDLGHDTSHVVVIRVRLSPLSHSHRKPPLTPLYPVSLSVAEVVVTVEIRRTSFSHGSRLMEDPNELVSVPTKCREPPTTKGSRVILSELHRCGVPMVSLLPVGGWRGRSNESRGAGAQETLSRYLSRMVEEFSCIERTEDRKYEKRDKPCQ